MNRSWKTYQEDLKTCISDESPIKVSEKPSTLAEKQTSTSACAVLEEISSTVNEENKSQPSCNYEVHHKRKTSPQTSENKKKQQKLDNFFKKINSGNRHFTGMWVRPGSTDLMAGKVVFLRGLLSPIRVVDLTVMNP
ncbi:hypothetical protein TNCV_1279951 [Trichonephila clavipes]|nr:hypothetical protein TNCV_1279951 [Trichonephila clavipes]